MCGRLEKQVFPGALAKPLPLQENLSSLGLRMSTERIRKMIKVREGQDFHRYKIPLFAMLSHILTLILAS